MAWLPLLLASLPSHGGAVAATAPGCSASSLLQLRAEPAQALPESHVIQRRLLGQKMLDGREHLDDEIKAYARRYHGRFSGSSMILYQHISKAAGTMLCEVGRANGCNTTWDNCHVNPSDTPIWVEGDPVPPASCESLSDLYRHASLTLEGNEKFLSTGSPCRDFWNVLVMRDPHKRFTSHLNMFSRWRNSEWDKSKPSKVWVNPALNDVFTLKPRIANNFFIRSLLGEGVYVLPFGAINASHLEEATRVLEEFDVLLVVDERNRTFLEENIRTTLGFNVSVTHDSRDHDSDDFSERLAWDRGDWERLEAANALDSELWDRSKALNRVDNLVFNHPKFAQVSATMPRTPCGYLAK